MTATHLVRAVEARRHGFGREPTGGRIDVGEHDRRAAVVSGHHPRRDVGVVVERRAHDLIAGTELAGDRPREGEGERRHVGAEHDPLGRRAQELADGGAGAVEELTGGPAGGEGAPDVGGVAIGEVVAHRLDRGVDHEGAGGAVEAGDVPADAGEAVAHAHERGRSPRSTNDQSQRPRHASSCAGGTNPRASKVRRWPHPSQS